MASSVAAVNVENESIFLGCFVVFCLLYWQPRRDTEHPRAMDFFVSKRRKNMCNDEEYYEQTEADAILAEFTERMQGVLTKSAKEKMESLERQVENLLKQRHDSIKEMQEIRAELSAMKREYSEFERKARQARLKELMQEFYVTLYRVSSDMVTGEKCNKCNKKRELEFLSPSGRTCSEPCPCAKGRMVYKVSEMALVEFCLRSGEMARWYKPLSSDSDGFSNSYTTIDDLWSGQPFESKETRRLYFRDANDCQRLCDYLNSQATQ